VKFGEKRKMNASQSEHFKEALVVLLDETFDNVHGYFLDKNTSLFETLSNISADEASEPVGGKGATLAAQVKHVAFYLEVIEKSAYNPNLPKTDWGEIWRKVSRVTHEEWLEIQIELRANYNRILNLIKAAPGWPSEDDFDSAIAVIAHTSYHLGEIRQALCILRP
jgi:hypothetical protein